MRRAPSDEVGYWHRVGSALALVVVVVLVGVGVALVVAGGALGVGLTLVGYRDSGRPSLQAPGVVLALGAELIVVAILVAGRAGSRIRIEEGEGP